MSIIRCSRVSFVPRTRGPSPAARAHRAPPPFAARRAAPAKKRMLSVHSAEAPELASSVGPAETDPANPEGTFANNTLSMKEGDGVFYTLAGGLASDALARAPGRAETARATLRALGLEPVNGRALID